VLAINRAPLVIVLTLASAAASCGSSPTVECQTNGCGTGNSKPYQACSHTNGDRSYSFGGQSCDCPHADNAQCQDCTQQLVAYCDGTPTGAGGMGGGGGGAACTATFAGAFSGTYSPCAVTVTYTPSGGVTDVATAGNTIPGTSYTWTVMSFVLSGMPATGTFTQTQSFGASNEITQLGGSNPPVWEAGYGSGTTFGSATLTITSLGPSTDVNGQTLYQSPHGTWTGTLVDQNPQTAKPDVMETITF